MSRRCVACGAATGPVPGRTGIAIPEGWPVEVLPFLERGAAVTGAPGAGSGADLLCARCWMRLEPSPLWSSLETTPAGPGQMTVIAPFTINEPLLALVRFLKFEGGRRVAPALAWWMARAVERGFPGHADAVLVPVPLHGARLAGRGYNQAALLAAGVRAHTGIPLEQSILRRTRRTRAQSKLAGSKRGENVRGAFGLRGGDALRGRIVLIVDDLVTTGATVAACAEALSGAGPAGIMVLAAGMSEGGGKIPLKSGAACD